MTDAALQSAGSGAGSKTRKTSLIIGVALALVGAGGGFLAVSSGVILGGGQSHATGPEGHDAQGTPHDGQAADVTTDVAFVDVEPVLISLQNTSVADFLRFRIQLEVDPAHRSDVEHLSPRIMDLLNTYLRALAPEDFEDPLILPRLRAQILRRLQIAAGPGRIRDVLIMEFVLN